MRKLKMAIHAYDKLYLEKCRTSFGRMIDFAIYELNIPLASFWKMFLDSDVSTKIENGDSATISGKSGIELAYEVIGENHDDIKPRYVESRSPEYWLGWALAYYQWKTNRTLKDITDAVSIDGILKLYNPYHEMDINQFCDKMNELYLNDNKDTNLKRLRKSRGFSQKELADISNVPLRTLQQYEQGRKNINKAQGEYIIAIAKALFCKPEELLEQE